MSESAVPEPSAPAETVTLRQLLVRRAEDEALRAHRIATLAAEVRDLTTAEGLLFSYLSQHARVPQKSLISLLAIFETAVDLGHNVWPAQVRELVAGKDVLDYGCGSNFYGVVFKALGVKTYLGVDMELDLHTRRYRSRRCKGYQKAKITVSDAIAHVPGVRYVQAARADFSRTFDVVLLHTVTEHLTDIDGTFAGLAKSLRPDGTLWFLHDNFYSWAGHHGEPSSRAAFDPKNPAHLQLADWAHLPEDGGRGEAYWQEKGLNRIRLDELRAVTERHFTIESWQEIPVASKYRDRLTPEIKRTRGVGCTERELLTQHIICLARKHVTESP